MHAFTDLPDSWTVIADAEALFHDIHGLDVSFDTNVLTVRVFIQDTIAPALVEEDHKDLAVKVACQLSLCISPTTKSQQRNGTILPIWRSEQEVSTSSRLVCLTINSHLSNVVYV